MVSSAYLRLLIFLLAILIPACASSSPTFRMMYSAYKLKFGVEDVNTERKKRRMDIGGQVCDRQHYIIFMVIYFEILIQIVI